MSWHGGWANTPRFSITPREAMLVRAACLRVPHRAAPRCAGSPPQSHTPCDCLAQHPTFRSTIAMCVFRTLQYEGHRVA
eukprot:3862945-Rhodomonas_salina.4